MQATNPAGPRQPGAGNSSHSHTDITEPHTPLTRKGDRKAPEHGDGPSSSGLHQAPCPDDHRSGESMLQFNMFKRNPLFPRRLCSPNIMYFNANPSRLWKAVITVQMLGFFKAKSLTGTEMVSSGVSLAEPVSSDSTKRLSRCCLKVVCGCSSHLSSEVKQRRSPSTLWLPHPVSQRPLEQNLRLPGGGRNSASRSGSAPAWGSSLQACLADFTFTKLDPTIAWAKFLR